MRSRGGHGDPWGQSSWHFLASASSSVEQEASTPPTSNMHRERQGLIFWEEGDAVPVPLQHWDGAGVAKIEKQRSKHLTKQPYMVFSRFQHLLFLEGCVLIWLRYLQVPCTMFNLGHFFFFFGGGVTVKYSFSQPPLDSKP